MDPNTVILVLAAHLICTGGLLYLIGRQMPRHCGLGPWATGLALFGTAYLTRLAIGLNTPSPAALAADIAMVVATLLFVVGLRQFVGRVDLARRPGVLVLVGFATAEALGIEQFGAVGRHAVLNVGLGSLYAWLAWNAVAARHLVEAALRGPLMFVTALMGGQSALTLLRGLHIAQQGIGAAYGSLFSQVYYGYSTLAAVLLAMGLLWMVFTRLNHQLAELASRDALTRVLNRIGLDDVLQRHFGARNSTPVTLLALDVDHFKRINDTHGHATGDMVLRAIADTLVRHVRPADVVARIGGEEFLVCCPAAEPAAALALAERLREAVATLVVPAHDGHSSVRCTASLGIAQPFAALADWPQAAADADRALYAAKAAGRNCVLAA